MKDLYTKTWLLTAVLGLVVVAPCLAQDYDFLTPIADAFVESGNPAANHGSDISLYTGDMTGDFGYYQTIIYLKFDLSGIPPGSFIWEAQLWLYERICGPVGTTQIVGVYRVDDCSWNENDPDGINWNNKPALGALAQTAQDYCGTGGSTSWYIEGDVNDAFQSGATTYCCAVVMENDVPGNWWSYYSKEWGNTSEDPEMHVHWDPIDAVCCVGQACTVTSFEDCMDMGGSFYPEYGSCDPNPCPSAAETAAWGAVKATFR